MAVTKEEYLKEYKKMLELCHSGKIIKDYEKCSHIIYNFHKTYNDYIDTLPSINDEDWLARRFPQEYNEKEVVIGNIICNARHLSEVEDDGYYYPLDVIYTYPEKIYDGSFERVKYDPNDTRWVL